MKEIVDFLIEVNKLKEMQRTGWVLMDVKNPETISEHTFRVAFVAWLLAERKNLNIKRVIKSALSHDLCEIYAGDIPPFFHYVRSPETKWVRLSEREKEKRGKKKFNIERKSLLKLTKNLSSELNKEIFSSWLDFEKKITGIGKFVKQVDRVDTLIQSVEYFGPSEKIAGTTWWEWTEEIVDDPLLLEFLGVIQKKFYGKVIGEYKKDKELENILDFILEIGKLKKMPRTIWVLMGLKNPETVASHLFSVAIMAWIFGREKIKLNMEKTLKMALCHELPSVYTGDLITPFTIPKNKKEGKKVFQTWPHLSREEKRKRFLRDYQKEKKALKKLTLKLKAPLRREIFQLFDEYKTASSPEARFCNQINVLAVLLQGLQYKQKHKSLPIDWMWEWALERCESSFAFRFIGELKKKFLN